MYNSLKGKNLVRITGQRRCLKFKPAKSGREESLPSTDEGELNAISRAMRHGELLFFIRSNDGTTLDVLLDRTSAIRTAEAMNNRMSFFGNPQYVPLKPHVRAYERRVTALMGL
jgi:hypothetical protein